MVEMLKNQKQPTTLYKVCVYTNTDGNEQANRLAKISHRKEYKFVAKPYEFAHPTPYYRSTCMISFSTNYIISIRAEILGIFLKKILNLQKNFFIKYKYQIYF